MPSYIERHVSHKHLVIVIGFLGVIFLAAVINLFLELDRHAKGHYLGLTREKYFRAYIILAIFFSLIGSCLRTRTSWIGSLLGLTCAIVIYFGSRVAKLI